MIDLEGKAALGVLTRDEDVFQVLQPITHRRDATQEGRMDHQHPCAAIVQQVLVVVRHQKRVERNGHGADLDGSEERIRKLRRIR